MTEKKPTAQEKAAAAREQLVREYLEAFGLANPKKKKPEVTYENGYFVLKYGMFANERYRKAELEQNRDRLRARAAAAAAPATDS